MANCLVEVLPGDVACEQARLADQDAALAVPLALDHRLGHGRLRPDEARGAGHDLRGGAKRPGRPGKRREDELARLGE